MKYWYVEVPITEGKFCKRFNSREEAEKEADHPALKPQRQGVLRALWRRLRRKNSIQHLRNHRLRPPVEERRRVMTHKELCVVACRIA